MLCCADQKRSDPIESLSSSDVDESAAVSDESVSSAVAVSASQQRHHVSIHSSSLSSSLWSSVMPAASPPVSEYAGGSYYERFVTRRRL